MASANEDTHEFEYYSDEEDSDNGSVITVVDTEDDFYSADEYEEEPQEHSQLRAGEDDIQEFLHMRANASRTTIDETTHEVEGEPAHDQQAQEGNAQDIPPPSLDESSIPGTPAPVEGRATRSATTRTSTPLNPGIPPGSKKPRKSKPYAPHDEDINDLDRPECMLTRRLTNPELNTRVTRFMTGLRALFTEILVKSDKGESTLELKQYEMQTLQAFDVGFDEWNEWLFRRRDWDSYQNDQAFMKSCQATAHKNIGILRDRITELERKKNGPSTPARPKPAGSTQPPPTRGNTMEEPVHHGNKPSIRSEFPEHRAIPNSQLINRWLDFIKGTELKCKLTEKLRQTGAEEETIRASKESLLNDLEYTKQFANEVYYRSGNDPNKVSNTIKQRNGILSKIEDAVSALSNDTTESFQTFDTVINAGNGLPPPRSEAEPQEPSDGSAGAADWTPTQEEKRRWTLDRVREGFIRYYGYFVMDQCLDEMCKIRKDVVERNWAKLQTDAESIAYNREDFDVERIPGDVKLLIKFSLKSGVSITREEGDRLDNVCVGISNLIKTLRVTSKRAPNIAPRRTNEGREDAKNSALNTTRNFFSANNLATKPGRFANTPTPTRKPPPSPPRRQKETRRPSFPRVERAMPTWSEHSRSFDDYEHGSRRQEPAPGRAAVTTSSTVPVEPPKIDDRNIDPTKETPEEFQHVYAGKVYDIRVQPRFFVAEMNRGLRAPIGFRIIGKNYVSTANDNKVDVRALKPFSGDCLEYRNFRMQIILFVDRKQISPGEKAHILRNLLQEEASEILGNCTRRGITEEDWYPLILELDNAFANIIEARRQLDNILTGFKPKPGFSIDSIRHTLNMVRDVELHCQEFEPYEMENTHSGRFDRLKALLGWQNGRNMERWAMERDKETNINTLREWLEVELKIAQRDVMQPYKPRSNQHNNFVTDHTRHWVDQLPEVGVDDSVSQDGENSPPRNAGEKDPRDGQHQAQRQDCQYVHQPNRQQARQGLARQPGQRKRIDFNKHKKGTCPDCQQGHDLHSCAKFVRRDWSEKPGFIFVEGICYHCMEPGHPASECKNRPGVVCGVDGCKGYHHHRMHPPTKNDDPVESIVLHHYQWSGEPIGSIGKALSTVEEPRPVQSTNLLHVTNMTEEGLHRGIRQGAAWIKVGDRLELVQVAFDSCSNNTNIDANFAKKMKMEVIKPKFQRGINVLQKQIWMTSEQVKFEILPLDKSHAYTISAYTAPEFMRNTPCIDWSKSVKKYPHFKEIQDYPEVEAGTRFKLLLGTDFHNLQVVKRSLEGQWDEPVGELTRLGWTFCGPATEVTLCGTTMMQSSMTCMFAAKNDFDLDSVISAEERIDRLFQKQFDLEDYGIKEPLPDFSKKIGGNEQTWTEEEKIADDRMTVYKSKERPGYGIKNPFKTEPPNLVNNHMAVFHRQNSHESQLDGKDSKLMECVEKMFAGYEEKGYIRKIGRAEIEEPVAHFLPWFSVLKESSTTPVRPVFDAAAKNKYGQSLNSEIMPTPSRLKNLFDVLLRFRQWKYCLSGDVSEMFLRIELHPDDRRFHRFVVRGIFYEWISILFGNRCSPDASQKVLEFLSNEFGENYPRAVEVLKNSIYMDDAIDSVPTEEELSGTIRELQELMLKGNMVIRKFYTNSRAVLASLPKDIRATEARFDEVDTIIGQSKVLGISYDAETDCFLFEQKIKTVEDLMKRLPKFEAWTKRYILKAFSTCFDAIGLVSPFIVRARVILQKVWKLKTGWDEVPPEHILEEWHEWLQNLLKVHQIRVPRWLGLAPGDVSRQLHTFTDASTEAIAVAIYVRVEKTDGTVYTNLVCSKSRVTSMKPESISRTELIACVLGTRLARAVLKTIDIVEEESYFWTDSQVCLYWINSYAKASKAFVANRISEIQRATEPDQWRHVPTLENPADVATRDVTVEELTTCSKWWRGPDFLSGSPDKWPGKFDPEKLKHPEIDAEITQTKKKASPEVASPNADTFAGVIITNQFEKYKPENFLPYAVLRCMKRDPDDPQGKRFAPFNKVYDGYKRCLEKWYYLRRIAEIFIIYRRGEPIPLTPPNSGAFGETENFLIKQSQLEWFKDFYDGKDIKESKVPSEIRGFHPYVDAQGVLRSATRLSRHPEYAKAITNPPILHRKSGLARLFVASLHHTAEHPVGQQYMKGLLVAKFKISGVGVLCREAKASCIKCRIKAAEPAKQIMADIPHFRFGKEFRPFQYTGLDYCGPFEPKGKRGFLKQKTYILVLTCLQCRAVHLEVVDNQHTSGFLMALSRFSDLRGSPDLIVSDNQLCFTKGSKDVREWINRIDFEEIKKVTAYPWMNHRQIEWRFNPPRAPHHGGVFEIMVKATKRALYNIMEEERLGEYSFRTVVSGAMNLLNSRPISPPGDNNDGPPITPNSLLRGSHATSLFQPRKVSGEFEAIKPKDAFEQTQYRIDLFWRRFQKEILSEIQNREKWVKVLPDLKIGDVVLEIEPNLPRGMWRMAVVVETLPSPDGHVRTVRIRNADRSEYTRSITRLVPIVM